MIAAKYHGIKFIEGYANPRILLIFPGSVNCKGLNVRRTGHENITSPPPFGAAPLLMILK